MTITLPDDLHADLKAEAARTGRTMSEIITYAYRLTILRRNEASRPGPVRMPTYGEGGLLPGISLDSNAALRDYFDDIGEKSWP